jgi:hypothetical protein
VVSATVLTVNVSVTIVVGPTPDLSRAKSSITNTIYTQIYQWPVGQSLSYRQISRAIDSASVEVFDIQFAQPTQWNIVPPVPVGGAVGQKIMPGSIAVYVQRA